MKLCVIPARGGSKRIPRKNIREFFGKPMIAWSIDASRESGCFDQIIVSTDCLEIADIAVELGANVPFIRPPELASDFADTISVLSHAIQWYRDQGQELSAVCCLYATAPFVQSSDIKKGMDLLEKTDTDRFVFTATSYSGSIHRALRIDPVSGKAYMWQPEQFSKRTQDLETMYHDAGQFYWGRPESWLNADNLFEASEPLLLPKWRVQDIDTPDDWIMAELLYEACSKIH